MRSLFRLLFLIIALGICLVSLPGKHLPTARAGLPAGCVMAPAGMVSWWAGDGNANDIRGDNTGTLNGDATATQAAKVFEGFTFDGNGDFVEVPDSPSLSITGALSIEAWVRPSAARDQVILAKYDSPANQVSYYFGLQADGSVEFVVYQTGNASTFRGIDSPSGVVSPGSFAHVAATFNPQNQEIKIYVNGMVEPTSIIAASGAVTSIFDSTSPVRIGAVANSSVGILPFIGAIDEVKIFNRVLKPSEISDIVLAGSFGNCRPRCLSNTSMVSWWTGDDNPFDLINSNHGSLEGSAAFAGGKVGRAFLLNGTEAYVNIPDDGSLEFTTDLTLDAWIKPNNLSQFQQILSKWGDTGHYAYQFGLAPGGALRSDISENGTTYDVIVTPPNALAVGTWSHVAMTFSDGTFRLYVNGVMLAQSSTFSSVYDLGDAPLSIGRSSEFGGAQYFDGLIDEPAVYGYELSADEIKAISNAGFAGRCKPCTQPPDNLIGWWTADGDTRDHSQFPNPNDGVFEGGAGYAAGKVGQAFSFNGTDAAMTALPSATPGVLNNLPLTIDAWVKPELRSDPVGTNADPNFYPSNAVSNDSPGNSGHGFGVNVFDGGNKSLLTVETGSGFLTFREDSFKFSAGRWYHIAVVYGKGDQVYVDGNLIPINANRPVARIPAPSGGMGDSADDVHIGKFNSDEATYLSRRFFKGLIDEVEVFSTFLSQRQIRAIVAAGVSGKCKREGFNNFRPAAGNVLIHQVGDATVTYDNPSSLGETTYQTLDSYQPGPMPAGYDNPLEVADITSTVGFNGKARICFNLQAAEFAVAFSQLRILHLENNDLVNRTSSSNPTTRTLCADVTSFSPFVIAKNTNAPTAAASRIEGQITDSDGNDLPGVVVELSGNQTGKTITDAGGRYFFNNVETNGFYTVAPARTNYVFSPANRSFSLIGSHTEAAFSGSLVAQAGNPLDAAEFFVRQQYIDVLGREPDNAGFNYWSDRILTCRSDAACVSARRRDVAAAFFVEQEFQQSGSFIYNVYQGTLGRRPSFNEYASDRSLVVGGRNLDTSKHAFIESFVRRVEFASRFAANASGESFVDAILGSIRQSTAVDLSGERAQLVNRYQTGANQTQSRSLVLLDMIDRVEMRAATYNAAFVLTEYFGYLRRDPDASGYQFWVNVLNSGDGRNYPGMVCSFITSAEYQQRFSPVVSRGNSECAQ